MFTFPPTFILRHRRENLKKCSLRGLEKREDLRFFTYPRHKLPDTSGYILLALGAPPLTQEDKGRGLLLLDGTWRYAELMQRQLSAPIETRSIPEGFLTAYPRRQDACEDPTRGLATVEALFIAYTILGRETGGLLDGYHWKDKFLDINRGVLR
ncbi:MAG: hypothetical protein ACHQT8_07255 [Chlamydiales bacterium]